MGCRIAAGSAALMILTLTIIRGLYRIVNVDPSLPVMATVGYLGLLIGTVLVTPYVLRERERERRSRH